MPSLSGLLSCPVVPKTPLGAHSGLQDAPAAADSLPSIDLADAAESHSFRSVMRRGESSAGGAEPPDEAHDPREPARETDIPEAQTPPDAPLTSEPEVSSDSRVSALDQSADPMPADPSSQAAPRTSSGDGDARQVLGPDGRMLPTGIVVTSNLPSDSPSTLQVNDVPLPKASGNVVTAGQLPHTPAPASEAPAPRGPIGRVETPSDRTRSDTAPDATRGDRLNAPVPEPVEGDVVFHGAPKPQADQPHVNEDSERSPARSPLLAAEPATEDIQAPSPDRPSARSVEPGSRQESAKAAAVPPAREQLPSSARDVDPAAPGTDRVQHNHAPLRVLQMTGSGGEPSGELPRFHAPASLAHPTESRSIDERVVAATVARGLSAAVHQKGGSLTIRLIPETLGALRIQMNMDRGAVDVRLETGSAQAHELLSGQLAMLRTALESKGLTVERLAVQLVPAHHLPGTVGAGISDDRGEPSRESRQQPTGAEQWQGGDGRSHTDEESEHQGHSEEAGEDWLSELGGAGTRSRSTHEGFRGALRLTLDALV